MTRIRRVLALFGAIALSLLVFPAASPAVTPADIAVADDAIAWIHGQQLPDGSYEVAGFPGFETRDASLAIASLAQTGATWNTSEAREAVASLEVGANGPTPFDELDAYAADLAANGAPFGSAAGAAAKTILLGTRPFGLDSGALDAAEDGSPVDLTSVLDDQCDAFVFSDTLYGVLAGVTVCGDTPADGVANVRAAQQADGAWGFAGDPGAEGVDGDTTGLALQALVAGGAGSDDPTVVAGLRSLALTQQADGGWIDFFGAESNASTTAIIVLGIAAAGYDVASPCWRDTVAPELADEPYADPTAWIRSQQAPDGHIISPYDGFGVNTLTTSQSVHALVQRWLPVARNAPQTCEVPTPIPPTPPTPGPTPPAGEPGPIVAGAVAVVGVAPRFTG